MNAYTLLTDAVSGDPGRPLLTMYDDATGERIELSVKTFENWVAKTANFLLDELFLEPGEAIAVALPPHWQTAVLEMAALCAGGRLTAGPARITCWLEGTELPDDPDVEEIVGLSLRPMGLGLAAPDGLPAGVLDYAVDVRSHGDRFVPRHPMAELDLVPLSERVLTDQVGALLPALAGGGSLVLCVNPDPAALAHRAEIERVTATIGLAVAGIPQLA